MTHFLFDVVYDRCIRVQVQLTIVIYSRFARTFDQCFKYIPIETNHQVLRAQLESSSRSRMISKKEIEKKPSVHDLFFVTLSGGAHQ
jgi:hypothetical protein